MLDLLKELCALNGVSGEEDQVRDFIRAQAAPHADSIRTDALGNLIVFKKGRKSTGNRLMLCAHMDEVGIIVTRITDEGFLKFEFVGCVDRRVAIGKPVVLGPDRVPGIIGLKAVHLVSREEAKKAPKTESLYIDIGVSSKEEAQELVELGTYGSFVCDPEEFGSGFLKAKAIDDRIGCAVMLELLKDDLRLHRSGGGGYPWGLRRGLFRHPGDRPGTGDHHCRRPAQRGGSPEGMRPRQGARHLLHGWSHHL